MTTTETALKDALDKLLHAGWGVRNAGRDSAAHDDAWRSAADEALRLLQSEG
jgi:hypothetical protein